MGECSELAVSVGAKHGSYRSALAQTDGVINLVSALLGIRHLLPTRRAGNFLAWIILSTW